MSQHEVKIEELERPVEEMTPEQAEDVQGGLLLPAVQKVREAAARTSATTDDNTDAMSLNFSKIEF